METEVILGKKNIIWDLDNTLYRITPEFADILDEATAIAAIEDLGVPLDFETAKAKVKESYRVYRDGGEIFVKEYGIDPKDIFWLIISASRCTRLSPMRICWKS